MREQIIKNVNVYYEGHNLTGDMNELTLNSAVDMVEKTVFGSSFRKKKPGLKDSDVAMTGFWNASTGVNGVSSGGIDLVGFKEVGSTGIMSILPNGTAPGGPAYLMPTVAAEYSPSGSIGDMFGYTFNAQGSGQVVKGAVLQTGEMSTNITTASHSTHLGANSTSKSLYVALHLFSSTGGAFKVSVRASSESNMGGATTMVVWKGPTLDSSMIGKAKFSSTKITSTKLNYYRAYITTTGASTGASFNGAITCGIL